MGQAREGQMFTFELRWLSGRVAARFVNTRNPDVDNFTRHMDVGIFAGIPGADRDEEGRMIKHYQIYCVVQRQEIGQLLRTIKFL